MGRRFLGVLVLSLTLVGLSLKELAQRLPSESYRIPAETLSVPDRPLGPIKAPAEDQGPGAPDPEPRALPAPEPLIPFEPKIKSVEAIAPQAPPTPGGASLPEFETFDDPEEAVPANPFFPEEAPDEAPEDVEDAPPPVEGPSPPRDFFD